MAESDDSVGTKVEHLIQRGAIQLSRKYRIVGVLPDGRTGLQCLRELDPDQAAFFEKRLEEWSLHEFLSRSAENQVELTVEEFNEWLRRRGCKPL
jgi:hypothetical protein